ncbi:MAG: hypothetical protein JWO15_1878 [Sphingomonadales bacterium]|nr:hypothetical protein [Sphingomonadales bacterium]
MHIPLHGMILSLRLVGSSIMLLKRVRGNFTELPTPNASSAG